MDLLRKFKEFVKSKNMLRAGAPALLAVSGGVDSMVLAHLFKEADFTFGIAHCNFQLRGEESDLDELSVRQLAGKLAVPFFVKRFDTAAYAQSPGISIQIAARNLRYNWFRELCREHGFAAIATAHHLNDSVETALLNFVRGTGLPGLTGIAPVAEADERGAGLIRPLLFATRAEIEDFAKERNISWREDSSNASDEYARNYIRRRVVPLLEELNPNFAHTAERNLRRLSETEANYNFLIDHYLGEKLFQIDLHRLALLPAPRQALHHVLKSRGFTDEQTRQAADHIGHPGFELRAGSGWRLFVDREKIFLTLAEAAAETPEPLRINADDLMVTLPDGSRLMLMPAAPAPPFPDGRNAIAVDAGKLRFPLLLRPWLPGDAFQPFGMGGQHQKLQDFFTNLKISRLEKEEARVLENADGRIVWVLGYRPDERFKIDADTQKALKISYIK